MPAMAWRHTACSRADEVRWFPAPSSGSAAGAPGWADRQGLFVAAFAGLGLLANLIDRFFVVGEALSQDLNLLAEFDPIFTLLGQKGLPVVFELGADLFPGLGVGPFEAAQ